ncbi:GNAT family N-acetyltransferase [Rhodonellum ikkaensis]|uniref:L-amino acid N-acyltransferase YncA n=2 Tax=Rhodonellum TaxID=336827 RepID=A0A1H3U9H7_9BACT|nr:GNAT family N-acetyltransferase [Rhodonellum ikkaensis]SDZ58741.1 L-amino acid N-acyltransferase YncA [Rhodonellum ikkaensis]
MEIRYAQENDIPSIVGLLKVSLGEDRTPKSEALWRWKHLENPFGQSPVLLAEKNGEILGVRAFLRWNWQEEGKTFRALRAVDTAVHPNHLAQGIFSKLTSSLVDDSASKGFDFIFNTPNSKSLPGYQKMGWLKQGKIPIKLQFNSLSKQDSAMELPVMDRALFATLAEQCRPLTQGLHTPITKEFLLWRYSDCPIFPYGFCTDRESYLFVFRLKPSGLGLELRITDCFGLDAQKEINLEHLRQELKKTQEVFKVNFTTHIGHFPIPLLRKTGSLPSLNIGPLLTLRDLNLGKDFSRLLTSENWGFSLGDLEVF